MRLTRIQWREVIKMFRLGACAVNCAGCQAQDQADWYINENWDGPYCSYCASKLAQAHDSSRSVTQFYSNTRGTQVETAHLEKV